MLTVVTGGMTLTWLAPQLTWLKLAVFRLNHRMPVPVPGVCVQCQNGVGPHGTVGWLGVSSTRLFRKYEGPLVVWCVPACWATESMVALVPGLLLS